MQTLRRMELKLFFTILSCLLSLVILAVLLTVIPLPTPFSYYNPLGHGPWPKGEITYYNDTGYDKSLEEAFRQWESAGLPNNFVETDKDSADIIFEDNEADLADACHTEGCLGHTSDIGYALGRQTTVNLLPAQANRIDQFVQNPNYVPTIIHEIGHVLGLKHNDESCSIMNSDAMCRRFATVRVSNLGTAYLCGPFDTDQTELARMYDLKEARPDDFCYDSVADTKYYNDLRTRLIQQVNSRKMYAFISVLNNKTNPKR